MKERIFMKIYIVSASRATDFYWKDELKGYKTIIDGNPIEVELKLYENNSTPIGIIYNKAIEELKDIADYIVFLHYDVIVKSVKTFIEAIVKADGDLLGAAGAIKFTDPDFRPISWFTNSRWNPGAGEKIMQAGEIWHKLNPGEPARLNLYGNNKSAKNCVAIDGLCLIFTKKLIEDESIRFDENYKFDLYDFDISRQVREKGYRIDVIDLGGLIHFSAGLGINKESYLVDQQKFLDKWGSVR